MARAAAGVLIVREGRVLLSPRGPHLGWVGGRLEPGETAAGAARREAREEVGCEVELVHAPLTYGIDLRAEELPPPAPLLRTELAEAWLARALGEPRAVDVPEIRWVEVGLLPHVPAAEGSVVQLLGRLVAALGPGVLLGRL